MRRLFVDDERNPPTDQHWDVARSYHEAIDMLNQHQYDVVSLDHDIASYDITGREYTGSDILTTLVEWKVFQDVHAPQFVYVHSANPSAYKSMKLAIDKYFKQ